MKNIITYKSFLSYLIKFIVFYVCIYFGLQIWIGLSIYGGSYNNFVDNHLDFFHLLRISLLRGAKTIAHLFGYTTVEEPGYLIRVVNARGVIVSYSCAGIAVMSFWAAFVLANSFSFKKKISWLISGILIIWIINVLRIGLFLVALNKKWLMPFGIDHHTWFNIASYGAILLMMYFLDKSTNHKKIIV
jgi:exosortase/archaeosortase family protein